MAVVGDGWGRVRIDADDTIQAVALRDRCQPDRGLSLEAADLQDRPARRRARGDERQEAGLALREKAGRGADPLPRFVDCLVQIRRLTADG